MPSLSLIGFVLFTTTRECENLKEKLFVGKSLCIRTEAEPSQENMYWYHKVFNPTTVLLIKIEGL